VSYGRVRHLDKKSILEMLGVFFLFLTVITVSPAAIQKVENLVENPVEDSQLEDPSIFVYMTVYSGYDCYPYILHTRFFAMRVCRFWSRIFTNPRNSNFAIFI
jgi:hypothetical protein